MLASLDLRWLTAGCQMLIGFALILLAIRVWWMPLHRRAVLFGPFLTDKGLVAMLRAWPAVFVIGLTTFIWGVSKWAYYERWTGELGTETANGIGLLEAILSVWAAVSLAILAFRACRKV